MLPTSDPLYQKWKKDQFKKEGISTHSRIALLIIELKVTTRSAKPLNFILRKKKC